MADDEREDVDMGEKEEKEDKDDKGSKGPKKKFEVKKWNAVALWAWGMYKCNFNYRYLSKRNFVIYSRVTF